MKENNMTISPSAIFNKKKRLPWRVILDELVIVDLNRETVLHLNEEGKDIWNLIDGVHSVSDIARSLTEIYNVENEQALKDVTSFILELLNRKLIDEQPLKSDDRPDSV